jgi:class 3 adenylate cyclase
MTTIIDVEVIRESLTAVMGGEKFSDQILQQFTDFINNASDDELFRISPLRYAEKHNVDHLIAINLFLTATRAGIFEFSWGTLCPSCGVFVVSEIGLRYLGTEHFCALCTLPYEADTDTAVEIAFTISPQYRWIRFHDPKEIDLQEDWIHMMFSTSIALFPEVHQLLHSSFQKGFEIEAGEKKGLELELESNHYVFIVPATHSTAHIAVNGEHPGHVVDLELTEDGQIFPIMTKLAPGTAEITIKNPTAVSRMVGLHKDPRMAPTAIEDRVYPISPVFNTTPYLTGKQLITNQTFHNLFPKESVPADEGLEFNNITFMFTDLKGSTALYDRIGDAKAYKLILQHFDILRDTIAENNGAVVKTMGDSIMACFATPSDATMAACDMKTKLRSLECSENLELKVGIHNGPTMAINTNEQLDFFGQTVNIASRVQNTAGPSEIVVTSAVFDSPDVQETIEKACFEVVKAREIFKGVSDQITIYRLM